MKKKLYILITLAILLAVAWKIVVADIKGTAFAVGDLTVDWGVPAGEPIFTVNGLAPGQTEKRTVKVINDSQTSRDVELTFIPRQNDEEFARSLTMGITTGGEIIYEGKILGDSYYKEIPLFSLLSGEEKQVEFTVAFDKDAGNGLQNKSLSFDISIGTEINIPDECKGINNLKPAIYGKAGNDFILGTNGNDLIIALEGNDVVYTGNGNDCIVSGSGNDTIISGNGDDIVVAGDGKDMINSGNGHDTVNGGDGDDTIDAGNGNDVVDGGGGTDRLIGSNGNDNLIGGEDSDFAWGGNGKDTCQAETIWQCEVKH